MSPIINDVEALAATAPPAPAPAAASSPPAPAAGPLLDLPVTQVVQHPLNPSARSDVDEDLAADIRAAGEIYERLVVRPAPGRDGMYELLSGHRRFAAAQHLAMLLVPVRVVDMDDVAAATFLLRANQSRKDLSLVEESVMVQGLLDLPDAPTQHALAAQLGRSDTWVSRRAKIARKPELVLTSLATSSAPLTFDDVDVLEEFDDDPDLQAKIAAAHGTVDFRLEVSQARQARKAAAFYAEAGEKLRAAGVDVHDDVAALAPDGLTAAGYLWEHADADALVTKLGMGEGWWAAPYQYQAAYRLFRPFTDAEREQQAARAERDAQFHAEQAAAATAREKHARTAAAQREFADTTAGLRRDFIRGLVDGKTIDRAPGAVHALMLFTARAVTVAFERDIAIGGDLYDAVEELAPWIGVDQSEVHDAAVAASEDPDVAIEAAFRSRAAELAPPQIVLASLAAQVEPLASWTWQGTLADDSIVTAWYDLLVTLGYEPSTVETAALAGDLPGGEG